VALENLTIKGFKSVRDVSLRLTPLNILIGSNGAGKSNLISVFRFLNQVIEEHLQLFVQTSGGAALCQVVVSTQPVELLNECSADDIVVVDKNGSESTFHRPDTEKSDSGGYQP
jgi:predicted ATPase